MLQRRDLLPVAGGREAGLDHHDQGQPSGGRGARSSHQRATHRRSNRSPKHCSATAAPPPLLSRAARVSRAQEHQALPNFKLLSVALEKVGIAQPIDAQLLAKGNPQAHMTLLQRIYAEDFQKFGYLLYKFQTLL